MTDGLFDHAAVLDALAELADLLQTREIPHQTIIMIGGSYLAVMGLREATRDIDTVTHLDGEMRRAIADVAAERGVGPTWLNDAASAFRPEGLATVHCAPIFEHHALSVVVPSADWVFLMKLYASRAVDYDDLVALWPHAEFATPQQAVDRFWEAYPHAAADEYLIGYVEEIARRAHLGDPLDFE